jgi:hypothetical protein
MPYTGAQGCCQYWTAGTTSIITGSVVPLPAASATNVVITWKFAIEKTAAGTAANVLRIHSGALGNSTDPVVFTFTTPVGTAVEDTGHVEVTLVLSAVGPGQTNGGAAAFIFLAHDLAATGLINTAVYMDSTSQTSGFNASITSQKISLVLVSGAATVLTVPHITYTRTMN